jgi:Holliday junction resolvase RusA-like endonuclease
MEKILSKKIKVGNIKSYQVLIKHYNKRTIRSLAYSDYAKTIILQAGANPTISKDDLYKIEIKFNLGYKKTPRKIDLDNIYKPLIDILEENGYLFNDAQIMEANIKKEYKTEHFKNESIEIDIFLLTR